VRFIVRVVLISLASLLGTSVHAQTGTPTQPPVVVTPQPATPLPKAEGTPISVVNNVSSSVSVDAVLLPASIGQRIFGKAISSHYAIVQMTVSNHNPNASLVLHSASLDYSHWLFSNNFQAPALQEGNNEPPMTNFQQDNVINRVASTDSRLVRGDLQDAQYWTWRNGFIRSATAAGTIASSLTFLTTNAAALAGISAYGNQIVPALVALWPDRIPLQVDRISDYGFQTNHVIPKSSSDIVVAFFPIERFLTPALCKLYIKDPAVFFVPGEMVSDPKYIKILGGMLRNSGAVHGTDAEITPAVAKALWDYEQARAKSAADPAHSMQSLSDQDLTILSLLQKASLNNIRLIISGVMTVDTNSVPANIDTVTVSGTTASGVSTTDAMATTWAMGSIVTVTIDGSFLTNGTPSFQGTQASVGTITTDAKDSTDTKLVFSFPLKETISSGTVLKLVITKTATDGSTTMSKEYDYTVKYPITPVAGAAPQ
jgi:hypothetical protein